MRVVVVEARGQAALRVHVVQVVDVNVYRPCGSHPAAGLKPSMPCSVRVLVKVLSILSCAHVLRVVVGDNSNGDISMSVGVGKSNHWMVSESRRTSVPGLSFETVSL